MTELTDEAIELLLNEPEIVAWLEPDEHGGDDPEDG